MSVHDHDKPVIFDYGQLRRSLKQNEEMSHLDLQCLPSCCLLVTKASFLSSEHCTLYEPHCVKTGLRVSDQV